MLISHVTSTSNSNIRTKTNILGNGCYQIGSNGSTQAAPLVRLARAAACADADDGAAGSAAVADALQPSVPVEDDATTAGDDGLVNGPRSLDGESGLLSMADLVDAVIDDDGTEDVKLPLKRGDRHYSPISGFQGNSPDPLSASITSASSSTGSDDGLVPIKDLPFRHVTDYTQPEDRKMETIDVWVIDSDSKHTNVIFEYVRGRGLPDARRFLRRKHFHQNELHHLKRVKRVDDVRVSIVLHTVDPPPPTNLGQMLQDDPNVSALDLKPRRCNVPAMHGSTPQQVAEWSAVWPVTYIPLRFGARAVLRTKGWPQAQIDWINAQLQKVWAAAQEAGDRGELPIACAVAPSWDSSIHHDANQPVTLVSAHDTRRSTGHPLSHSFRNLIGEIAALDRLGLRREGTPQLPQPLPPRSLFTPVPTRTSSGTSLVTDASSGATSGDDEATSSGSASSSEQPSKVGKSKREAKGSSSSSSHQPALPYLLTSMTLFASHEPCLLCSMSLLHSRVRAIFYVAPAPHSGGCGSVYGIHEDKSLNHKFDVWTVEPEAFPALRMRTLDGDVYVRTLEVDP